MKIEGQDNVETKTLKFMRIMIRGLWLAIVFTLASYAYSQMTWTPIFVSGESKYLFIIYLAHSELYTLFYFTFQIIFHRVLLLFVAAIIEKKKRKKKKKINSTFFFYDQFKISFSRSIIETLCFKS